MPPEYAAWLTRAAGANNLARETQVIAILGEVEQGLVRSFSNGGGVPYSDFARFQHFMAEGSRSNAHDTLLDATLPLIPEMIERLQDGINVAGIGCGQGFAINLMAQAFPPSEFIGYDFSEEAIAVGKTNARQMGLSNAHFEAKDASKL